MIPTEILPFIAPVSAADASFLCGVHGKGLTQHPDALVP